mmetsp:Transcript_37869/g.119492  ORF Transcript_37869/g.119492 Transcript_37869/m.119492 type:complete len:352 (+) Transcript_37869:914-1969(+)
MYSPSPEPPPSRWDAETYAVQHWLIVSSVMPHPVSSTLNSTSIISPGSAAGPFGSAGAIVTVTVPDWVNLRALTTRLRIMRAMRALSHTTMLGTLGEMCCTSCTFVLRWVDTCSTPSRRLICRHRLPLVRVTGTMPVSIFCVSRTFSTISSTIATEDLVICSSFSSWRFSISTSPSSASTHGPMSTCTPLLDLSVLLLGPSSSEDDPDTEPPARTTPITSLAARRVSFAPRTGTGTSSSLWRKSRRRVLRSRWSSMSISAAYAIVCMGVRMSCDVHWRYRRSAAAACLSLSSSCSRCSSVTSSMCMKYPTRCVPSLKIGAKSCTSTRPSLSRTTSFRAYVRLSNMSATRAW